jgi:hypothetical protein
MGPWDTPYGQQQGGFKQGNPYYGNQQYNQPYNQPYNQGNYNGPPPQRYDNYGQQGHYYPQKHHSNFC